MAQNSPGESSQAGQSADPNLHVHVRQQGGIQSMPTSPSKPLQSSPTKQQTTRQSAPFTSRGLWRDCLGAARTTELLCIARITELAAPLFSRRLYCERLCAAHGLSAAKIGYSFGFGSLLFAPIAKHTSSAQEASAASAAGCKQGGISCISSWLQATSSAQEAHQLHQQLAASWEPTTQQRVACRVAAQHVI